MTYLNNLKTWADFDREREKRFIDLLGGDEDARIFWDVWLEEQTKKGPVDMSKRCPSCGVFKGQIHGEGCEG